MVRQYPYTLELLQKTKSVFDESTASWIESTEEWVEVSKCRDETGGGGKVTTQDGEIYSFSSIVQLPKGTDGIKSGDRIRVIQGGNVRFEASVVRFSKDQLHSRLWV